MFSRRSSQALFDERWIRGIGNRRDTARLRLFLIPHAGGSASTYQLNKYFPESIELCPVQLPGRETRFAEPPLTAMDEVVDELAPAIAANADLPYALFGHSMGALIAFSLTRRLRSAGASLPRHLIMSAHRAPHLPDGNLLHDLPEEELAARLTAANPILLDPDLRKIFLPILRADLTLCETYAHEPDEPLPCPITALGGRADEMVDEAELRGWAVHTSARFALHMLPGGHFYMRGAEHVLAEHIRHALAA
jgi:medium-chain acyl-[acyl-carrier-protein] hydrolase